MYTCWALRSAPLVSGCGAAWAAASRAAAASASERSAASRASSSASSFMAWRSACSRSARTGSSLNWKRLEGIGVALGARPLIGRGGPQLRGSALAERAGQGLPELGLAERLGDDAGRTTGSGFGAHVVGPGPADEEHRHLGPAGADCPRDVEPAHARHAHVRDHEVDAVALRDPQ